MPYNIIRVIKSIYMYMDRTHIDIYIQLLLLPTGHLNTSRTLPHTHLRHRIHQSLKITFLPTTPRYTKREKHISVSNEQSDVIKIKSRANIIYGDSAAHTVGPHSNMQFVPIVTDSHIIEALPAKLSPYYPALSSWPRHPHSLLRKAVARINVPIWSLYVFESWTVYNSP